MLDICYGIGMDLDAVFNAKQSALLAVGKVYEEAIDCLFTGYDSISWTTSLKYLGMIFTAGQKLECDIDYSVRKFYTQLLIQYIVVVNLLPKSQKYS